MRNSLKKSVIGITAAAALMFGVVWSGNSYTGGSQHPPTISSSVVTSSSGSISVKGVVWGG